MKRVYKKNKINFIVPKFIYSTLYNVKSFQIKCGVMADSMKICVNLFDYKTGCNLNLTSTEYHMILCKFDDIIRRIEELRELKQTKNSEEESEEKPKRVRKNTSYQLTEFVRMRCRLNDGEEKNIKLIIEHVYTKQAIQLTFDELLEFDLIKFHILAKINECSHLLGHIIELYDFYVVKCVELNKQKLEIEHIPSMFTNSKNSHIFETIFGEMHINVRTKLSRDILYKTSRKN